MSQATSLVSMGPSTAAVAVAALKRTLLESDQKQALQSFVRALPEGAMAAIEFVVSSELPDGRHAMYRAATLTLNGRGQVNAAVAAYLFANKGPISSGANESRALVDASSSDVAERISDPNVRLYPLVTDRQITELRERAANQAGDRKVEEALQLADIVQKVFNRGVPLPGSEKFSYCCFRTMVHVPTTALVQSLHTYVQQNDDGSLLSGPDIKCTPDTQMSGGQRIPSLLKEDFERIVACSKGGEITPSDVPSSAQVIYRQRFAGSLGCGSRRC